MAIAGRRVTAGTGRAARGVRVGGGTNRKRGVGMAGTKAGGGTGTQATDVRDLVAIAELADILGQLGAESTDAPIDVAPCLDGLTRVARRIRRMSLLDAGGRELAARHYYAGVIAGACGDESAIARGVFDSLVRQSADAGRSAARCFAMLARIGRRHGRAFAAQSGDRVLA